MKPESRHPTPDPLLNPQDIDPEETREWREALEAVARVNGNERALFLLEALSDSAREIGLTPYLETVDAS